MSGSVVLSIEIELGWGVHDRPASPHLSDDGQVERNYLKKLLKLSGRLDIPISFDIVGHLLLDGCSGNHDGPYPEGWFAADPGTNSEANPLMYAPKMADWILDSETDHELCTHTFSHIRCDHSPETLVDTELQRVQKLHNDLDGHVSSFVPPRHGQPSNETLRNNGIRVARYAKENPSPTPLHRFIELTVGPHPQWQPDVQKGVLETYCTTYTSLTARSLPAGQSETHPVFRPLPVSARTRAHKYYLKRTTREAMASGHPVHLWCHLYDLCNEYQWPIIVDYFEYLADLPEKELTVETMKNLGERYL